MREPREPKVCDSVRVLRDLPELGVRQGMVGVVSSVWHVAGASYEVEFQPTGNESAVRVLLPADSLAFDDEGALPEGERDVFPWW
jgi:hypothetical protein